MELSPTYDKSYLFGGYIYKALGRPDKAERQFEKCIECNLAVVVWAHPNGLRKPRETLAGLPALLIRWQRVGNMELAGADAIIAEVDKLLATESSNKM